MPGSGAAASMQTMTATVRQNVPVSLSVSGECQPFREITRRSTTDGRSVAYAAGDTGALVTVQSVDANDFVRGASSIYAEHPTPVLTDIGFFDMSISISGPARLHGISGGYTDGKAGYPFPPNPLRR